MENVLVTGGAGLIGKRLTEALSHDYSVTVVDKNIEGVGFYDEFYDEVTYIEHDLRDYNPSIFIDQDFVFHLASDKLVNSNDPSQQFSSNIEITKNVLESMRENDVDSIAFTSSSTVYGECDQYPTKEDYSPLEPISLYGASKLAEESLISSYSGMYDFNTYIFRLANVVGPQMKSGSIIPDFVDKLLDNPHKLEILGNGKQSKSYITVKDCVNAMLYVIDNTSNNPENHENWVFNVGTESNTSVNQIANIVCDKMELEPEFTYTGGKRGWDGDVPTMQLDIERLNMIGWEPMYSSDEAVAKATEHYISEQ